ncbi:MAG: VanZ family protein [Chitinispirillia bacterium]|jgi:VanZ family protein
MSTDDKKNILIYTIPFTCWALLMLIVSSIPGEKLPQPRLFQWDKLAHCFEYFIFSLLCARYFFFVKHITINNLHKYCLSIGLAYAALDEVHQIFIPNRCCTWQDFLADSLGVIMGCVVANHYLTRKTVS